MSKEKDIKKDEELKNSNKEQNTEATTEKSEENVTEEKADSLAPLSPRQDYCLPGRCAEWLPC